MRILLSLVTVGLIGCVGGIDTPINPNPNGTGGGGSGAAAEVARKSFEQDVYPIISRMCATCHTEGSPQGNITGFVGSSLSDAYAVATGFAAVVGDFTTNAPILTKVTGTDRPAAHSSLSYSANEVAKISSWLAHELDARGANTGGGGGAENAAQMSERLLKEWSGCMTQTNFETADMRQVGNAGSGEGPCRVCHSQGDYRMVASNVSDPYFFNYITTDRYYLLQYFTIDFSNGIAAAKVIPNKRAFYGVAQGEPPHNEHPRFDPENNGIFNALDAFYTSTMNAKMTGGCGAPKL